MMAAPSTVVPMAGVQARGRLWAAARAAAPALAAYALLRLLGVVVLAAFADHAGQSIWALLTNRYDAWWYKAVATGGYDHGVGLRGLTNLVFFPLYPGLIAALDPILPGGPGAAGILVSWLAGLAAAWGLYAIGTHLRDRRTGIMLAALWAVIPHAVVESMAYTETLFTALSAWSLYALLTRRWLVAGGLCLLAGLVRPTAVALVAAVGLACLIAVVRRRDGWRPWVAGALAPLGLLGYLAFVAHRVHRLDGYFYLQDHVWGMSFDGGKFTASRVGKILVEPQALDPYVVTAVLLAAGILFVLAVVDRQAWPLVVFSAVVLALSVGGAGYYNAKARLIIPAFGLLLPAAAGLAAARPRAAAAVFTFLALGSAWFGAYLCLIWNYSP
jgi:hypothetical protein